MCEGLQFTLLCSLVSWCSCWLALDVCGLFWRSWDPRTQQTPLTVILPHNRGAQALGSGCVPLTPSEGEHKSFFKSSSSKGSEIFFQWQFGSAWQNTADGQLKVVCFTWKLIKILILRFSKTLCNWSNLRKHWSRGRGWKRTMCSVWKWYAKELALVHHYPWFLKHGFLVGKAGNLGNLALKIK